MNETTKFTYRTAGGECRFSFNSDFWVTHIDGASSIEVEFDAASANNTVGVNVVGQKIQPRTLIMDGAVFGDVENNRKKVLDTILPGVPARLYKEQDGKTCHLDGYPMETPKFEDGNGKQDFQFHFFCAYPYWIYGEETFNPFIQYTKYFRLPFNTGGTWQIASFEDVDNATIVNSGNAEQGFRAKFLILSDPMENDMNKNPQSEISLTNLTRGEELRFWVPRDLVSRGDVLEFCTIDNQKGFWNTTTNTPIMPALQTITAFNMKLSAKDNVFDFQRYGIEARCWVGAYKGVSAGE